MDLPFKRIRLSNSTMDLLDTCEQKFAIERFYIGTPVEEENPHFSFGHAWGNILQTYLLTQDITQSIWKGFLSYTPWVEQDSKQFWKLIHGFLQGIDALDKILAEYELVEFKGKPAIELGIRIEIDGTFYYVGFLDAVVRHRLTGRYAVVEGKSTASQLQDITPMYRHSGQGTGYSIALDAIVGEELAEYDVLYPVLQYPGRIGAEPRIQVLRFEKTLLDRLQWFMTLQLDIERIKNMFLVNHFPKRVNSCLKFNRPCEHFGSCHLLSIADYKEETPDPHENDYAFTFELKDVIADHIRRVRRGDVEKATKGILEEIK